MIKGILWKVSIKTLWNNNSQFAIATLHRGKPMKIDTEEIKQNKRQSEGGSDKEDG